MAETGHGFSAMRLSQLSVLARRPVRVYDPAGRPEFLHGDLADEAIEGSAS